MIKEYNPTSAGIRFRKTLVKSEVTTFESEKSLLRPLKGPSGRNNGRISTRHKQRGVKRHYRVIDFKRNKFDIPGKVATIEYDPNRGANIALINYPDGEKRYILAPEGLQVGMPVLSSVKAQFEIGNALPLENIPLGTKIHNIEVNPGSGGQIVRGAGNSAILMAKEGKYVNVKLPSGEVKKIFNKCYATIGVLGNSDHRLVRLGKAGRKRHLGWRPEVRGVTMGTNSHPHGGSYGHTGIGLKSPKTPWGKKARGVKTRRRKNTTKFIVTRRGKGN